MTLKTFKRYESKYLLNEFQYRTIMENLPQYMDLDENNKNREYYTIYNIYYDTKNNDIIRNSLSKPYYKEKLRLRSYASSKSPQEKVFLELKKKIGGVVSKRRATLHLCDAIKFIDTGIRPVSTDYVNEQVMNEIAQFLTMYDVSAKTFISYDRLAFFGKDDKEFRVTFDNNIKTRRNNISLEKGVYDKQLLQANQYLMEVKIIGAIPLWFTNVLSATKIYSTSFSKYGAEYKQYCEENTYCLADHAA